MNQTHRKQIARKKAQSAVATPDSPLWLRATISFILLSVGLYIILIGQYGANEKQWATGIVGSVFGFWFRR